MTGLPDHPDLSAHNGNVAVLRADVERTRSDLGATLEALIAKTDVMSRVTGRVGQARRTTSATVRSRSGMSTAVAAALLAALVAAGWWGISHRRSMVNASRVPDSYPRWRKP